MNHRFDSNASLEAAFEQIESMSMAASTLEDASSESPSEFDIVEEVKTKKEEKKDKKKREGMSKKQERAIMELVSGLEERLFNVVISSHNEIRAKIDALESKMEGEMTKTRSMIESSDKNRADEGEAIKEESALIKKILLTEIKEQIKEVHNLHLNEPNRLAKEDKEEKPKTSEGNADVTALAHIRARVDAAKKEVSECFGRIKTRLPFNKSTTAEPVALSDDDTVVASRTVLMTRRNSFVHLRHQGDGATRRWFIKAVTDPEPYPLKEGDELIRIGKTIVVGLSLKRVRELVSTIPESGTIEIRA